MKVLYVTQFFSTEPTHASAVTTYEIVRRLAQRGHIVTVVSANSPGIAKIYEKKTKSQKLVNTLPIPSFKTQWYDGFTTLFTHTIAHIPLIINALLVNQFHQKFDVVISMYHPPHLATVSAYVISRILKLPLVVKIYDFYVDHTELRGLKRMHHVVLGKINLRILKRSDAILVQSPELIEDMKEHGMEDEKLIIFPNGVDTGIFKPNIKCDTLRKKSELEGKKVLLYLGGIYRSKHPELLIKALPSVVQEIRDIFVLFVGEGAEKPKLASMAERLGVSDFVKFVGRIEHSVVPEFISLADVTVGPLSSASSTLYGATPLTVLEYMACEKPVIVSRGAVSESLVVDGFNAVLVKRGDIRALSSVILKLIRNKTFRKSIAHNARKYVEKSYSWNVLITKLEKVLDSVTNQVR